MYNKWPWLNFEEKVKKLASLRNQNSCEIWEWQNHAVWVFGSGRERWTSPSRWCHKQSNICRTKWKPQDISHESKTGNIRFSKWTVTLCLRSNYWQKSLKTTKLMSPKGMAYKSELATPVQKEWENSSKLLDAWYVLFAYWLINLFFITWSRQTPN